MCLVCVAQEIDSRYGRLYAYLRNDVTRSRPTVGLALDLLSLDWAGRFRLRTLMLTDAKLVTNGLLRVGTGCDAPLDNEISLDQTVLRFLLGVPRSELLDTPANDAELDYPMLAEEEKEAVAAAASLLFNLQVNTAGPVIVVVRGPEGAGKRGVAAALAQQLGGTVSIYPPVVGGSLDLREWLRRVRLIGHLPAVDVSGLPAEASQAMTLEVLNHVGGGWNGRAFLLGGPGLRLSGDPGDRLHTIALDLKTPPLAARARIWMHCLGQEGLECTADEVRITASLFHFTAGRIRRAARDVADRLRATGVSGRRIDSRLLNIVCREQCDHQLGQVAERLTAEQTWEDLVLIDDEMQRLREIANAVRNRAKVMEQWSFQRKAGGPGINALFFGPSGTGKTMAASVLGNDLAMEVYRVDLSRMVSKYIGETEKNLDALFEHARRAHAIVFFDEAEAVFGKRSEVKDAHDRYANMEIAYLLQRMEAFDGVAILATNLRKNIDNAFMRRLQFAVEFSPPTFEQRLEIWRKIWPAAAEFEPGLDLEFMASSFELTGGHIRNIAVTSAYLAAQDGGRIGMVHLVAATGREFQKLGRLCVESEFGQYRHLINNERSA